jgi:hypothetical protein
VLRRLQSVINVKTGEGRDCIMVAAPNGVSRWWARYGRWSVSRSKFVTLKSSVLASLADIPVHSDPLLPSSFTVVKVMNSCIVEWRPYIATVYGLDIISLAVHIVCHLRHANCSQFTSNQSACRQ